MRVLVTGSSKGIGRETAIAFVERGDSVCLHGRDPAHLADAERRLREALDRVPGRGEGRVFTATGDLTDPAESASVVSDAVRQLGGLDVLVNNAGIAMRGHFADVGAEVWDRVIATNSLAPAYVTHAALPHLLESRGCVVFVSSAVGLWGFPNVSAYAASKHALNGLAQSLRTELAPRGVAVGIAYVGITRNDSDKTILSPRGDGIVPARRPHALSQEAVARAIVRAAIHRRSRVTISFGARVTGLLARIAPRLLHFVLVRAGRQVERFSR